MYSKYYYQQVKVAIFRFLPFFYEKMIFYAMRFAEQSQALVSGKTNIPRYYMVYILSRYIFFTRNKCLCEQC